MRVIDTERIPIKLWLENIEDGALQQARDIANLPFAFKHIAIMPDSHQGYGMPIGGVMATQGAVVANAVGVDIGCGMAAVKTSLTEVDTDTLKRIMGKIREVVPMGFNHHQNEQAWDGFDGAPDVPVIQRQLVAARKQLGTLGGGNHFIEVQRGDDGHVWLMLHSGSRNFGLQVAKEYHHFAQVLCDRWHAKIPNKDLAFLPIEIQEAKDYLAAMTFCLRFAHANRQLMMRRISEVFNAETGADFPYSLDIHHNYAAWEHHFGKDVLVHRKGATKAYEGQAGIIPGSMGSASYIVIGRGNPESFMSCSHGAGRKMGRKEAQRSLNLEEEQGKMQGVIHGLRSVKELEEAPGAYKAIEEVMANQMDLVAIKVELKPLAVLKA